MPGHWKTFLTWACCAVTLLTLRLGSGLYSNGDGESVLPSERNKLTKPVDCGENWRVEQLHRGTHRGPRLILLPPACRGATATSLIGTHPKNRTLKKKKTAVHFTANHSKSFSQWHSSYIMHFFSFTCHLFKNLKYARSPKTQIHFQAEKRRKERTVQ